MGWKLGKILADLRKNKDPRQLKGVIDTRFLHVCWRPSLAMLASLSLFFPVVCFVLVALPLSFPARDFFFITAIMVCRMIFARSASKSRAFETVLIFTAGLFVWKFGASFFRKVYPNNKRVVRGKVENQNLPFYSN